MSQTVTSGTPNPFFAAGLADADPEIAKAIELELGRQQHEIELIASENIVSKAVIEAQGSVMTNKYAEGYPGRRYYGGCQFVDMAENLAIERVTRLFDCKFANVQPNSGSQANQAVFLALLQPGDAFMGLDLAAGGHLTHGSHVNLSGRWFKPIPYGVRPDDNRIDMDAVARLAEEHKPKLIIAGGSGYPRHWDFAGFRAIADKIGAYFFVDMAHFAGLVAGGVHPSPFPHAHVVTSTTHKTLRGPRGGLVLTNDEAIAKKINSAVFPGLQGGPLMHVIAAKAVAFGEALKPEFKIYAKQVADNAKALAATLIERGYTNHHRWHRQSSYAGGFAAKAAHRKGGGSEPRARRDHLQQEWRAVRYRKPHGYLRDSARDARRDLARFWDRRIQKGWRADRRNLGRLGQERRAGQRERGGKSQGSRERIDATLPGLLRSQARLWRQDGRIGQGSNKGDTFME